MKTIRHPSETRTHAFRHPVSARPSGRGTSLAPRVALGATAGLLALAVAGPVAAAPPVRAQVHDGVLRVTGTPFADAIRLSLAAGDPAIGRGRCQQRRSRRPLVPDRRAPGDRGRRRRRRRPPRPRYVARRLPRTPCRSSSSAALVTTSWRAVWATRCCSAARATTRSTATRAPTISSAARATTSSSGTRATARTSRMAASVSTRCCSTAATCARSSTAVPEAMNGVTFTRNLGTIVMDVRHTEQIDLPAVPRKRRPDGREHLQHRPAADRRRSGRRWVR